MIRRALLPLLLAALVLTAGCGLTLTDVPMPQDAHFGPHKYAEWS